MAVTLGADTVEKVEANDRKNSRKCLILGPPHRCDALCRPYEAQWPFF
jgi:hypothetical protein